MSLSCFLSIPSFSRGLLLVAFGSVSALPARDLLVDQRGGAPYATLSAAAAVVQPGDSIIIAPGSGPYRETLAITSSGSAATPIIVEGNGETVTGFDPMTFTSSGGTDTYTLAYPFATTPVVIAWQGRRILQDQATGAFLGPITLRPDGVTLELAPNTSTKGWEFSKRDCPVRILNASYQTYRNLVATGGTNDGFNLHGTGTGLVFENIAGYNNCDEGFSAHDTIASTINTARFWANDNGIGNVGSGVFSASNVRVHDNLGYGLWLADTTQSTLVNVTSWNNGAAQVYFASQTSGTCSQVSAWNASWSTPPWRRYKESIAVTTTSTRSGQAAATSANWPSIPSVATTSSPVPINPTSSTPVPSVTSLLQGAVSAGRSLVVLPAGIHDLSTEITLSNATGLEIDGTGATLVMDNSLQSILRLSYANQVTVKGLTLTYDPLPYTQATITSVSSGSFGFTVQTGYPDISISYVYEKDGSNAPAHLFNAQGDRHPAAYDLYAPTLTITSPRTGTAAGFDGKGNTWTWPATLAVGDQVAFDRRKADRKNTVEVLNNSGPVTFDGVTVLAAPALGFAGRYSLDLVTFRRVTIRTGEKPVDATQPRLLSTNADGINVVQCRVGPLIEHCDLSRMGDDSLNLHGNMFKISEVPSSTAIRFTWPGLPQGFLAPYRAGDTVRLYAPENFALAGSAVFASSQVVGTVNDVTTYQINFSAPAVAEVGQSFNLPALNCPGFIVRDNYIHDHRARGLRIEASDGVVERNRFERLTKSAVTLGAELGDWGEAGWVNNVTVSDNILRDIGVDVSLSANGSYAPGAISVYVNNDTQKPPYPLDNQGITIKNNVIDGCSVAGIHAYATRALTVTGNALRRTNLIRVAGTTDTTTGLITTGPISLDGLIDVTASGNATLVTDTIESYPVNTSFTTNQILGAAGDGWAGGWRSASSYSTTTGTVAATSPLDSGQRLGVSVTTQSGKTASSGAIGRAYTVNGTAGSYGYGFRYRADAMPANISTTLFETTTRASVPGSAATWQIATVNGTWRVYNGAANGGPNTYVDTGLPGTAGTAYDFVIMLDPTAHTWGVTISNDTTDVTLTGLNCRSSTFATDTSEAPGGRWLMLALNEVVTGGTTVGATGSASIDSLDVRVPATFAAPTPAYISDTFDTHAAGAAFTTGQTLGVALDGWAYGWRTASAYSTTTGTVATTPVLKAGHRLSASVSTQAGKTYSGGAVTRPYVASRITGTFDLSFHFRPDSASSNLSYVLFDTSVRTAVPGSSSTWQIASVNGTWRVYDGATNGGPNAYIDTGVPVTLGATYVFAITVNLTARTWGVTILDGTETTLATRTGLNWRTSTFATDTTEVIGGRWLNFSAQEVLGGATTTGATGTFSLDALFVHAPLF